MKVKPFNVFIVVAYASGAQTQGKKLRNDTADRPMPEFKEISQ